MIGIVSLGHASSHFLQLALPPLFPLLKAQFGVPWTLLGAVMASFYVASATVQLVSGFAVDRLGARPVLFTGIALLAGGTLAAASAPSALWLFPCAIAMGAGNGVFHPSDYAILNSAVTPARLGYAYSSHGVGGNLGFALAPLVSYGLGSVFGWRVSLVAMGAIGLAVLAVLVSQREHLATRRVADAGSHTLRGSVRIFTQSAIVLCFLYFVFQTMGTIGIQTFLPATLNAAFAIPLIVATSAVTAYLLGGTAGIVAGGFLAVRTARHDRVAAAGLLGGAILIAMVAAGVIAAPAAVSAFALAGFSVGVTSPSRDLIVRNATPAGASGRVYGFVYSGLDTGSMLGPLWFGLMLDRHLALQVLYAIAALFLIAIATVIRVRRAAAPQPA
ncbi:MAG: MFS transporter [Proteobacteria bacterium]|nr:MFS transporter [Pseudomonadota bacterium]